MKDNEITPKKRTAIKELLRITDEIRSSKAAMGLFIDQIMGILKTPEDIIETDGFFNLMKKEAKDLIYEEVVVKESLHALMYPLYHKYLTLEEINELIRFYETPLGQKLVFINPELIKEKMEISQTWVQELNLKFQKRMSKILEKKKEN